MIAKVTMAFQTAAITVTAVNGNGESAHVISAATIGALSMRFEFNDCHPASEILPSYRTHPRELRQSNPEIRRSLGFPSPVLSAQSLLRSQQRSKSFSKTTQNARSSRRAAICSASVFRTMNVDEDIARSSVSLRQGATLAAAPGALR